MKIEIGKRYIVTLKEEFAQYHDQSFADEYGASYTLLGKRLEQVVEATECISCKCGFDLDFVNGKEITFSGILGDNYEDYVSSIRPEIDKNDIQWW